MEDFRTLNRYGLLDSAMTGIPAAVGALLLGRGKRKKTGIVYPIRRSFCVSLLRCGASFQLSLVDQFNGGRGGFLGFSPQQIITEKCSKGSLCRHIIPDRAPLAS
jgi:hypothetical protein